MKPCEAIVYFINKYVLRCASIRFNYAYVAVYNEHIFLTLRIENMYFFAATYQHTDKEGRIPIELGMTVPFQKVRTNKGDAYRNTTSVFICPCAGMWSLML